MIDILSNLLGIHGVNQIDPGDTSPAGTRYVAIGAFNGDITVDITATVGSSLTGLVIKEGVIMPLPFESVEVDGASDGVAICWRAG